MKYIILTCMLALTQLLHAQSNFNPSEGIATPKGYKTVVPYENVNGKLIITVEIDGKPRRFVFDTGMSITLVDKAMLDASNHSDVAVLAIDQSGKEDSLRVTKLNSVSIGGATFGRVPVMAIDAAGNPLFKCFGVDGYLGNNLLAHTVARVSSADKTITFTDSPAALPLNREQSSEILFLSEQNRSPHIRVKFINGNDTITEPVLFDAGANDLYRLSLAHIQVFAEQGILHDIVKGRGNSSLGVFGSAADTVMFRAKIPVMDINGAVLKGLQTETTNVPMSSLGSRVFDYGTVTFDYINGLFYFEPFQKPTEVNETLFPVNPTLNHEGKFVTGVIWDKSLEGQISVGDQIVAIDGTDYTKLTPCDLMVKGIELKDKNRATLSVKNASGKVRKITMERK